MTTTETTLVIILICLLSVFFLLCIAAMAIILKILSSVKRVIGKAEDVVDSVEAATEVLRDAEGKMTVFKLVRNIMKMAQKRSKK